jgi:hypothetical protein
MARAYTASVVETTPTTGVLNSPLLIDSKAATRLWVTELMVASSQDAANSAEYVLQRQTATDAGGAAVTPALTDAADPAAVTTAKTGITTAFTTLTMTGSALLDVGINQRATFRYIFQPGREAKYSAAANVGAIWSIVSQTAAFTQTVCITFEE